jgi:L-fucose isomerase-like protein
MATVGIIAVGHPDYIGESAQKLYKDSIRNLKSKGIDIIYKDEIATDSKRARALAREIIKNEIDCVILYLSTWIESPVAMSVVREIEHMPFAVWGAPMFKYKGNLSSTGSFVSFAMFTGSLKRLGYNFRSLLGLPDNEDTLKEALTFCQAAFAYQSLKISTVGLVGYTSMSIYPGTFDHLLMRKKIGPEIQQLDTYTLINKMKEFKDEDCEDVIKYLNRTAKIRTDISKEDLLTVSKMYLAMKKICQENDFKAINVKCQYELSKEFGMVACVPLSILAENSVVAACEGDILVTVSMLLLHYLAGNITAYADIININEEGTIKLSPCGFIPYSMGAGDKNQKEIRNFMPGVGFKGIQNSFVFKPGKVTILRLVEDIGDYHIVYTTGEGLPTQLRQGYMPALDVKIDGSIEKMIDYFAGQHYAICYGDLSKEIEELSRIMGIECIKL